MSTSPWYSFLVACASADSTAPKTTSRSTFFSREIASTNINISRFMPLGSLLSLRLYAAGPGLAPLEIHDRGGPRVAQLVQLEAERMQRRGLPLLLAHLL